MDDSNFFRVGLVLKPQGLRGEAKIQSIGNDIETLVGSDDLYLETNDGYVACKLYDEKARNGFVFAKIEGNDTYEAVDKMRNKYICISRDDAKELPDDNWYIVDLLGLLVVDSKGKEYGLVKDVLQYGAADILLIAKKNRDSDLMLSMIDETIIEVDIEDGKIVISDTSADKHGVWS